MQRVPQRRALRTTRARSGLPSVTITRSPGPTGQAASASRCGANLAGRSSSVKASRSAPARDERARRTRSGPSPRGGAPRRGSRVGSSQPRVHRDLGEPAGRGENRVRARSPRDADRMPSRKLSRGRTPAGQPGHRIRLKAISDSGRGHAAAIAQRAPRFGALPTISRSRSRKTAAAATARATPSRKRAVRRRPARRTRTRARAATSRGPGSRSRPDRAIAPDDRRGDPASRGRHHPARRDEIHDRSGGVKAMARARPRTAPGSPCGLPPTGSEGRRSRISL